MLFAILHHLTREANLLYVRRSDKVRLERDGRRPNFWPEPMSEEASQSNREISCLPQICLAIMHLEGGRFPAKQPFATPLTSDALWVESCRRSLPEWTATFRLSPAKVHLAAKNPKAASRSRSFRLRAIVSFQRRNEAGAQVAATQISNRPMSDLDSASGEVQLQLIVPGTDLGPLLETETNILILRVKARSIPSPLPVPEFRATQGRDRGGGDCPRFARSSATPA